MIDVFVVRSAIFKPYHTAHDFCSVVDIFCSVIQRHLLLLIWVPLPWAHPCGCLPAPDTAITLQCSVTGGSSHYSCLGACKRHLWRLPRTTPYRLTPTCCSCWMWRRCQITGLAWCSLAMSRHLQISPWDARRDFRLESSSGHMNWRSCGTVPCALPVAWSTFMPTG